jgi:hypothetical protein
MQIEFERAGGFTGAVLSTKLNTDDLRSNEAQEWERLVRDAKLPRSGASAGRPGPPDRFEYWLRISGEDLTEETRIGESQLTEPQRELVRRLMERARTPQARPGAAEPGGSSSDEIGPQLPDVR